MDGLIPPPVDGLISSALDELCPQLVSTPLLQEKVRMIRHCNCHVCCTNYIVTFSELSMYVCMYVRTSI